jgi:hypothetical protein
MPQLARAGFSDEFFHHRVNGGKMFQRGGVHCFKVVM